LREFFILIALLLVIGQQGRQLVEILRKPDKLEDGGHVLWAFHIVEIGVAKQRLQEVLDLHLTSLDYLAIVVAEELLL
jgi:hypothetical protein